MTEHTSTGCFVCDAKLESEKERNILICFTCRTYGLLNGCWPERERISVLAGANCSSPVATFR
jgi:hypothetical protein